MPFLTAESVAAKLTERGFKWFFRTTPVAIDFAAPTWTFLREQKAAGQIRSARSRSCRRTPSTATRSPASSPTAVRQGQLVVPPDRLLRQLHGRAAAGAAAQGEESRRGDLHLLHLGRDPLHQDDEGGELEARDHDRRQCRLQRSRLREEPGRIVEGLVNRSTFAGGKPGSVPALFNELYKKKTGGDDLDDVSARGLQGSSS